MIIERLEVGLFAENCYIVACEKSLEGVIIDPGDESDRILFKVNELKIDVKYILITHAHLDHVKELPSIKAKIDVPVMMHPQDFFLLQNLPAQAAAFGLSVSQIPTIDRELNEGDEISFGEETFNVLHTPGQSPGSVSFVGNGVAFVGDVLFMGSIGRTDLPGGNYDTLIQSIKSRLFPLGDETIIYPGHGPPTTLGQEKRTNPFLI
ncbi:MAG: MBL fold metallo-hydrolase [Calditrichaeota bacterium]|nr:MAG: MBL fold metallo-hydrolase [Calditrichota bacterium]